MSFLIEYSLPSDLDFVSLKHTPEGWEVCLRTLPSACDRHGQPIPPEFGWGFRGKTYADAFRKAESDARGKFSKVLALRNRRPKPGERKLTPEEELLAMLDLS